MTPTATPYRGQSQRDKGWKTFTDPVAGYSIRYPANVFVQSGRNKNKIYDILTLALGNEQGMTIQIEPNPQHLSMEKFLESRAETNMGKWLTRPISPFLEPVKVAGLSAYQLEYQRADYFQLYSGEIYILLPYRRAQIYIFSVGGYGHGGIMLSPEGKNRFFQILATFQIRP